MSKKPLPQPTEISLSFEELQKKWYGILEKEGFDEQENTDYSDRPLKRWSGISSVYVEQFQPPGQKLISSFPESLYREEERFKNHKQFKALCIRICEHGNSKLTPKKVAMIWDDYCDGKTTRECEILYQVSDTTVFRVIHRVTEWMNLMDTSLQNDAEPEPVKIVLREFDKERDIPFIYASWRNALWFDEPRDERLASEFFSLATHEIRKVIKRPDIEIRIACDKEDPDFIAGYSVFTGNNLEFVYVKVGFRRKGIAKLLVKGMNTISSPPTQIGEKLMKKWNLEVKENHGTIQ